MLKIIIVNILGTNFAYFASVYIQRMINSAMDTNCINSQKNDNNNNNNNNFA